jgi:hypothetical protein
LIAAAIRHPAVVRWFPIIIWCLSSWIYRSVLQPSAESCHSLCCLASSELLALLSVAPLLTYVQCENSDPDGPVMGDTRPMRCCSGHDVSVDHDAAAAHSTVRLIVFSMSKQQYS